MNYSSINCTYISDNEIAHQFTVEKRGKNQQSKPSIKITVLNIVSFSVLKISKILISNKNRNIIFPLICTVITLC